MSHKLPYQQKAEDEIEESTKFITLPTKFVRWIVGLLVGIALYGPGKDSVMALLPARGSEGRDRFQHQSSLDNFTIIAKLGMLDTINTNVAAQTQRISDMDRRIERIENAMIENSLIERK